MSDTDGQTRSRRAVLAAAGGAVAALAAESLVRAAPAAAADHDPVKLGELNTSSNETRISYQRNDAMAAPAVSVQSRRAVRLVRHQLTEAALAACGGCRPRPGSRSPAAPQRGQRRPL